MLLLLVLLVMINVIGDEHVLLDGGERVHDQESFCRAQDIQLEYYSC